MATNFLSSDVYEITELIEQIKNDNISGVDQLTLAMSIFGYFSELGSAMMQSAVTMAAEYSNEAIPVKAKFEKNIITHALTLGIEGLNAQPATQKVIMLFPEDILIANMVNDRLTLDKDMKIMINKFEFHLDYDVIISRSKLPDGSYVYTGMYNIIRQNPISSITNPYLPPIGRMMSSNVPLVGVTVDLHQVEYTQIYKKILTTNPLENKIITFEFESQLASFDVDAVENGEEYHLTPVYDGLISDNDMYCYYQYMDTNNIRIKFNEDIYLPQVNADVTVNVYTTQGDEGNFTYIDGPFTYIFSSDNYSYNRLYASIQVIGSSSNGIDRKSVEELKKLIPPAALARGNVTNTTDLNNYFNQINTDDVQLLFLKKIDNNLERLYYSYLLMRKDNMIVPLNTIPVNLIRSNFDGINNDNYVFNVGNMLYYTGNQNATIRTDIDDEELAQLEDTGFVYMNPFMCVVNKSPFYVSYYLTIMNKTKFLTFEYINQDSQLQFIATTINWRRELFTDRNTYKLDISLSQNILDDMDILIRDENDPDIITDIKVRVALVLYNSEDNPYRYKMANFVSFDEGSYMANFQVTMNTEDIMDDTTSRIRIEDMMDIGTATQSYGFFEHNVKAKLYVYVINQDGAAAGRGDADVIIPYMTDYALCNIYEVYDGVDFFFNYSHIMASTITVKKQDDTSLLYTIDKMPVIRYTYINSEERMQDFLEELEVRRLYIEQCLTVLEDSFGIDFKFFNTYGPSKLFSITDELSNIDRVNLSLQFRCKLASVTDNYIEEDIIGVIKDYIEDINNGVSNLHMPNLITEITNQFREQIVFFEFVSINDYGPAYQHIWRPDETLTGKIPEFLCINTRDDGTPDITIEFVN